MTIAITIGSTGKRARFEPIPVAGFAFSPGEGLTYNGKALPEASQHHIVRYGLTQWLADATAGEGNRDTAQANVSERIGKLESGELKAIRGERGPTDNVATLAARVGREELIAALRANGKADVWKALTKEKRDEAIAAYVAKHDDRLRKEAERQIAARTKQADAAGDLLADLGLG